MTELIGREEWEKSDPLAIAILQMRAMDPIGKFERLMNELYDAIPIGVEKVNAGGAPGTLVNMYNIKDAVGLRWNDNINPFLTNQLSSIYTLITTNSGRNFSGLNYQNTTIRNLIVYGGRRNNIHYNYLAFHDNTGNTYDDMVQQQMVERLKNLVAQFKITYEQIKIFTSNISRMLNSNNNTKIKNVIDQVIPNNPYNLIIIRGGHLRINIPGNILHVSKDFIKQFNHHVVQSNIVLDIAWMIRDKDKPIEKPKLKFKIQPNGNVIITDKKGESVTAFIEPNVNMENFDKCGEIDPAKVDDRRECFGVLKMVSNLMDNDPVHMGDQHLFSTMDYKTQLANSYMILRHLKWPLNKDKTALLKWDEIPDEDLDQGKPLIKRLNGIVWEVPLRNPYHARWKQPEPEKTIYFNTILKAIDLVNDNFQITKLRPIQAFEAKKDTNRSRLTEEQIAREHGHEIKKAFQMFGGSGVEVDLEMIGGSGSSIASGLARRLNSLVTVLNLRKKALHERTRLTFEKKLLEIKALEDELNEFADKFSAYNNSNVNDGKTLLTADDMTGINSKVKRLADKVIVLSNGLGKIKVFEEKDNSSDGTFTL